MMSVRKNERKESKMDVQTKAIDLSVYTIDNALKEKIIPKRDRWALGSRVVDTALELVTRIDTANSLRLDNNEEAGQRHMEQKLALAATYKLMTLVYIIRRLTHFDESVHKHWTELVKELQELLRGWIDSDRKRRNTTKQ